MIQNHYISRNIPNPKIFEDVYHKRIAAKKAGDKTTANALKLILNTTYGATLNKYNDLYDPLHARSVCISGQLYLLELANHLIADVPGLKVVQLNTDGIMVELEDTQLDLVRGIVREWETRTGFNMEEDEIKAITQKDVNGYVEVATDGSVKVKGGYLVRGIAPAGAFNINNNAIVIADAIREYFLHHTAPENTILADDDISHYQLIAKAGAKYREAWHMVDGEKRPVQKVNRVYATTDPRYGKLFKVKAADDSEAKIEKLPEHCIIDNSAIDDPDHTKISQIDKQWYIDQAKAGIDRFLGIVPEKPKKERKTKNMATAKKPEVPEIPVNVHRKLLNARAKFLESNIRKSGKNMKLKYTYFELEDIVPAATRIFAEEGLLPVTSFTNEAATMTIYNVDDPIDTVSFTSPMRDIEPIISNTTGGEVTNAIQRLGSVETYQRRYLYMIALDIVEADEMEAQTGSFNPPNVEAPAPKPPVTPVERQEIKEQLTAPDEQADELQLAALKAAVKKLRQLGGHDEQCMKIAVETEGFTKVSRAKCEALVNAIAEKVGANDA